MSSLNLILIGTISLIVFGILVGVLVAWHWLNKYAEAAVLKPRLLRTKQNNGVIAIVTERDKKTASLAWEWSLDDDPYIKWLYSVRTAIPFYNPEVYRGDTSYMAGTLADADRILKGCEVLECDSLHIPFSSSHQRFGFEAQKGYYRPWTLDQVAQHIQDSITHRPGSHIDNLKIAVIQWLQGEHHKVGEHMAGTIPAICIALFFVSVITFVAGSLNKMDENAAFQSTIAATSPSGSVNATSKRVSTKIHPWPLVHDTDALMLIRVGTVVGNPQPIGGQMVAVEIKSTSSEEEAVYAPASLGLKTGDTVFVRWMNYRAGRFYYVDSRVVVTEAEARALVATGKFHFEL